MKKPLSSVKWFVPITGPCCGNLTRPFNFTCFATDKEEAKKKARENYIDKCYIIGEPIYIPQ